MVTLTLLTLAFTPMATASHENCLDGFDHALCVEQSHSGNRYAYVVTSEPTDSWTARVTLAGGGAPGQGTSFAPDVNATAGAFAVADVSTDFQYRRSPFNVYEQGTVDANVTLVYTGYHAVIVYYEDASKDGRPDTLGYRVESGNERPVYIPLTT
jgi:hypothetical protein